MISCKISLSLIYINVLYSKHLLSAFFPRNFQPAAETRLPQASDPKHKRAPNESESAVRSLPTITEIQQKQNFRNHDETR